MLKLKPKVSIKGIRTEMSIAATIIHGVFQNRGVECVITSALDGVHRDDSLHYKGLALDVRWRDANAAGLVQVIDADLRAALGNEFDVVLEPDHWHIEFDPD